MAEVATHRYVTCRARETANNLKSTQACEAAEQQCEDILEEDQHMPLPSTGRLRQDPPPLPPPPPSPPFSHTTPLLPAGPTVARITC